MKSPREASKKVEKVLDRGFVSSFVAACYIWFKFKFKLQLKNGILNLRQIAQTNWCKKEYL